MNDVPESVWLVGLSGAGKSGVGRLLAQRLRYRFVDLDDRVEALAGETIAEVFSTGGEARFRALEKAATLEMAARSNFVVATGGGWMARSDIERVVRGRVRVWLRVRPETAIHRLLDDDVQRRPMLAGPEPEAALAELLAEREGAYAEAELALDTDGLRPDEVADAVLKGLRALGFGPALEGDVESSMNEELENRS